MRLLQLGCKSTTASQCVSDVRPESGSFVRTDGVSTVLNLLQHRLDVLLLRPHLRGTADSYHVALL